MAGPRTLAGLVMVAFIGGTVCSFRAGKPADLPPVALEWELLFHLERAGALALLMATVGLFFLRAWKGHLPVKVSTGGVEWGEAAKVAEQSLDEKREEATRKLQAIVEQLTQIVGVFESTASNRPEIEQIREEVERSATEQSLIDAIEQLPEQERIVLVLSDIEGFSRAEVAEIIGVTQATVTRIQHRARKHLKALLANSDA